MPTHNQSSNAFENYPSTRTIALPPSSGPLPPRHGRKPHRVSARIRPDKSRRTVTPPNPSDDSPGCGNRGCGSRDALTLAEPCSRPLCDSCNSSFKVLRGLPSTGKHCNAAILRRRTRQRGLSVPSVLCLQLCGTQLHSLTLPDPRPNSIPEHLPVRRRLPCSHRVSNRLALSRSRAS